MPRKMKCSIQKGGSPPQIAGTCPPGAICIDTNTCLLFVAVVIILGLCVYIGGMKYREDKKRAALASNSYYAGIPSNIKNRLPNTDIHSTSPQNRTTSNNGNDSSSYHNNGRKIVHKKDNSPLPQVHVLQPTNVTANVIQTVPTSTPATSFSVYESEMLYPPLRRSPNVGTRAIGLMPINIETRGVTPDVQQVGILSNRQNDTILALYGRPTYRGSNKWIYYTGTDKFHSVKLPVEKNSRDCTGEYGCEELYDDDEVTVKGYRGTFTVSIYGLDSPRYIPYII